ncbi:MAG: hypothetical protein EXR98_03785 [Gemmataceae bacterium]|nr:hypothetical protein [Gemmataceae bacterium]
MAKVLGPGVPPPWNAGVAVADKVEAIQIVADFRGKTTLALTIEGKDEGIAKMAERLGKEGLDLARNLAPQAQKMLGHPAIPPAVRKELIDLSERALADLDWKVVENQLQVSLARRMRPGVAALITDFKPLVPRTAKEEINLGGEVADACVGGGGRYLCYLLREKKRVAVFDVQQGIVVKEIEIDGSALIAAGAKQLAIVSRSQKTIALWDLARMERDRNAPLPDTISREDISYIIMGSNSLGPIYGYLLSKRTFAIDLPRLTVRDVHWSRWSPTNAYGPLSLRATADGRTILGHGGGWAGLELARFEMGKQVETQGQPGFSAGSFGNISEDGQTFYIPGLTILRGAKPVTVTTQGFCLPAREPGFFLSLNTNYPQTWFQAQGGWPGASEATLYTDNPARLVKLPELPELQLGTKVPWEKIVHYYPRAGLLITLHPDKEQSKLVLRPIDVVKEMDKANLDYLVVFPQPAVGTLGKMLTQKLNVRSKKGKVEYTLMKGPAGLTVSPQGQIDWPIPFDFPDPEALAVISIRDGSDQDTTHRLRIVIDEE